MLLGRSRTQQRSGCSIRTLSEGLLNLALNFVNARTIDRRTRDGGVRSREVDKARDGEVEESRR